MNQDPRHSPPSPLWVGQHVDVTIDGLARDGRGTVWVGERLLHVASTLPGDDAWVRITALDRHGDRAHGVLVALRGRGPGRRTPPCPQHEDVRTQGCTGCAWMPWRPAEQRQHLRALLAAHDLTVSEVAWVGDGDARHDDGACGYRWSAKRVAFQDASGVLRLGSYRARSHHGAAMTGCLVDHPTLRAVSDEVETVAQDLRVRAWRAPRRGAGGTPGLRYIWLKTDGERVLLTLITGGLDEAEVRELADGLSLPAGVAWSVQDGQGNSMRGSAPVTLRGVAELQVSICGQTVPVGPLGFLQPNPAVAARCYEALVRVDDAGAEVAAATTLALDLYAGAGVTTALLRRRFDEVHPCESWPESAALLGVPPQKTAAFLAGWLASRKPAPDLIVANPPRAGMGAAVTRALLALAAPRVHVMSCSPKSLSADLDALSDHYDVVSLQAWATLPQTPHVEVVARLQLRSTS